jgi:hypothetical protein
MNYPTRIYYTEADKSLMWDRFFHLARHSIPGPIRRHSTSQQDLQVQYCEGNFFDSASQISPFLCFNVRLWPGGDTRT